MKATHVLRTDGGASLGLGHVARCLTIAKAIRGQGGTPEIALGYSNQQVCSRIKEEGIPFRCVDPKKRFKPQQIMDGTKVVVFDFSHQVTRAHHQEVANIVDVLSQSNIRSVLIDGKGGDCLSALSPMRVDALMIPYAGAEKQKVFPGAKMDARGPHYMILDDTFLKKSTTATVQPSIAQNILVTAGGSDPHNLTLFFMKVLAKVTTHPRVRIVIGPSFSRDLTQSISSAAHKVGYPTTLVRAPGTLAHEIWAADLALSASGLTKYELAFCGTPSVLISIDANHAEANLPFTRMGTCYDAGRLDMANIDSVAKVVEELILSKERRCKLAMAGIAAVDGHGIKRLMGLING